MNITERFGGVKVLEPRYFEDERGYYCETYSQRTLEKAGIHDVFVQDNHFLCLRAGTIRGIHFQNDPAAQSKLIRCTKGSFMSVAVDLRKGSPTYKKWTAEILSAENRKQFYIPRGFGHCCMSLEDMTEGQYKVDSLYAPECEGAIRWNDPEIGIAWPDIPAIVSAKDQAAPLLVDSRANFTWNRETCRKVIVTGASGFVGRKLVRRLLGEGCEVTAVVRDPRKIADMDALGLRIVQANLSQYRELPSRFEERGFDTFFHLAWDGTFGESFRDYSRQLANAAYAGDAIVSAKELGCRRFVLAGTIVQTEAMGYMLNGETDLRVSTIYGTAKNAAEMLCKTLANQHGIEMNTAILASVYGEGDCSRMIQNVLIDALLNGEAPKLVAGENLYDWIYVDDVVCALDLIATRGKPNCEYYVGHRELQRFEDLVIKTRDIVAPDVALSFGTLHDKTRIDYSLIERAALYRDAGFECRADFAESIRKTAEWLKERNEKMAERKHYVNRRRGGGSSL